MGRKKKYREYMGDQADVDAILAHHKAERERTKFTPVDLKRTMKRYFG